MFSFRALRQKITPVIRFWIAGVIWFKQKKLCLVPRLCCIFKDNNSFVPDLLFQFEWLHSVH